MDKRKLLLVAISVGLFLVIAIGAALIVFTPGKTSASAAAFAETPSVSSAGHTSGQSGIAAAPPYNQSPYPTGDQETESAGNGQETISRPDPMDLVRNPSDIPGLQSPQAGAIRQDSGSGTVISVRTPSSAAVPDTPPAGRAVTASAVQRPAAETTGVSASAPAASAPAVSAPAPAQNRPAAVQTRIYDDYWVQTGAFSTIATAERVKESLHSRGITSIIENREVDGRMLFRVRVGPYTSQNEADYWLSLIRSIDGFEDSQVRVTQSRR